MQKMIEIRLGIISLTVQYLFFNLDSYLCRKNRRETGCE